MIKYYVFLVFFISTILKAGPLDIESIKKECLLEYKNESSEKYTQCLKSKINNILYKEDKKS
jgi:hypothetical protein